MSVTGAIMAGIGAAGSIGGAAIASHGATSAANAQAAAADRANATQTALGQEGLNLQTSQWNQEQQNLLPFLQGGQAGFANLENLLGIPVQGNLAQFTPASSHTSPFLDYNGQDRESIFNSGGQAVSRSAEQTQQWQAQGIPYKNVYAADGGNIAVRTDINPDGSPINSSSTGSVGGQTTSSGSTSGVTPLSTLVNPALGATGSLMKPFGETWKAPTADEAAQDPGYQFGRDEGQKALERSAAARGDILSGGTAKGLLKFGNDYASTKYNDVFNRDLTGFTTRYNQYNNDQSTQFNRLAALMGLGQTTASTLGTAGQNYANSGTTILNNVGTQVGNNLQNAAAARASGYVGSGNAWAGAVNGTANNLSNLYLLSQLGNSGTNPMSYLQTDPTYGTGVGYHP
jgi:hypothetical protein